MLKIANVKVRLSADESSYSKIIASLLNIRSRELKDVKLIKRSIDARRKDIHYICSFAFNYIGNEQQLMSRSKLALSVYKENEFSLPTCKKQKQVIVVGSGPAGMFCALSLAYAGMKPVLIERGKDVDCRKRDIEAFWQEAKLDENSNVQFGEGGAGTFSDGKLTTNIKDIRKEFILKEFVKAGAPKEILYEAHAHIGTDYLETVVKNIRQTILDLGGTVMFETTFIDFETKNNAIKKVLVEKRGHKESLYCDELILAIGHSARDTYRLLHKKGIDMIRKPFAVGVRIEHLQEKIDLNQYKRLDLNLKAAEYKLAHHNKDGRGVFTFCMCPGGHVVASSSMSGGVVTNGMSEFARDGKNANSALLVSILPEDFAGDDVFAGLDFQVELEQKAFALGGNNYYAPVQLAEDFINKTTSTSIQQVVPTYQPGVTLANLWDLFPTYISEALVEGLLAFNKKIPGFASEGAIMSAVESRSSSPVKIVRDALYQSNIKHIYPIGEGAGAAGGIMTSAIDGIKCAQIIIEDNL